jgi:superfamily II DNA or RNA helicase
MNLKKISRPVLSKGSFRYKNAGLRPYQNEGIQKIFNSWRSGVRSVLFQMPTGTGKTVLFSEIVRRGYKADKKILIVVHRKELVDQITDKLRSVDVDLGEIIAGKNTDYSKIIQVASIQTLSRRQHPDANLIIIDECHHSKAETYKKLWEIYPQAKFLGVTATPIRLSGEGFDDLFDELIESPPVSFFIENKFLVPIKQLVCSHPNLADVKKRQGDYVTAQLSGIMLNAGLMSNLIESYINHARGKSTIVFAVDVEHSTSIAERYNEAGVKAAHIDASTTKAERDSILLQFKQKKIQVVSNVEIITEGFDFPECEAVQLARPTKSLALYLQMVGRIMRPAKGKDLGYVLDNAGLWLEHGLATIDRTWSLTGARKKTNTYSGEIAMDEDGVVREVNRYRPQEVEGLELIPVTVELERLLSFEYHLKEAKSHNYKMLYAYNKYQDILKSQNAQMSSFELDYIKKRFSKSKKDFPVDKHCNSGFWFHEEKRLGFRK